MSVQYGFLPNIEFMQKLIASQLQKFAYQQLDENLYREMAAHLNETLDESYGESFTVTPVLERLGEYQKVFIEVTYMEGRNERSLLLDLDSIKAATFSQEEEFDYMLEGLAKSMFDLIELGRNIHDKRLVSIANTQFELGFMALRKATREQPDGTF